MTEAQRLSRMTRESGRAGDMAIIQLSRRVAVLGDQVPQAREEWARREAATEGEPVV